MESLLGSARFWPSVFSVSPSASFGANKLHRVHRVRVLKFWCSDSGRDRVDRSDHPAMTLRLRRGHAILMKPRAASVPAQSRSSSKVSPCPVECIRRDCTSPPIYAFSGGLRFGSTWTALSSAYNGVIYSINLVGLAQQFGFTSMEQMS